MKPNINPVVNQPQLSNNGHSVDGALWGAGSLWPRKGKNTLKSGPIWSTLTLIG